ncbi:MAG: 50S ribosomal protein L10 [Thermoanaerobacteraceae bacterium]|nr:50S ribosomal protein L10 [Thermoanaerobacteraceae bacterium]
MSKTREQKSQIVEDLKNDFQKAQSVILTDYRGLTVEDEAALRKKFREAGAKYEVIKNTLAGLAAKEVGLEGLDSFLAGPTAAAFGYDDPVLPAKILAGYAKDHEQIKIKGGIVNGRVIGIDEVKALAELPPREELIAKMLGSMQAPISGLAGSLSGIIRKLLYALNAVAEVKGA